MAISPDISNADKAARVAILNKIAKEAEAETYSIVDLAKAYNYVVATEAPQETTRPRTGGFA